MLQFFTDFADEAVVIPLIVAIGATIMVLGWPRGAIAWLLAAGATLGTILVFKLLAIACGPEQLRTPSGHAAAAAVVAGSLTAILVRRHHCLAAAVAAFSAAILIGGSRLLLAVHTVPEVLSGSAIGIIGAVSFAWLAGSPPPRFGLRWVALVVLTVMVIFHGNRLRAEPRIWRTAYWLSHHFQVCRSSDTWSYFHERP